MKLPKKEMIIKEEYKRLYGWDIRQYFANDKKDFLSIFYLNRVEKMINCIEQFIPKGKLVLDIGCAQATISILLAEKGYKVVAADLNCESLQYAALKYELGDCMFVTLNAEKLPFKIMFDVIILGEFLEHVPHPDKILRYYKNYLNDDGIIVVTTPNGSAPHNWKFKNYTEFKDSTDVFFKKFGPERDDHLFGFRFNELKILFFDCGYDILISDYSNSYLINPLNFHKFLPICIIQKINIYGSKIPLLKKFISIGLFFVGRKTKI